MAFVLVQHLDPKHKSILPELIRHYTSMPVFEIVEGMIPKSNCVYIPPSNSEVILANGHFQLSVPSKVKGLRLSIDHFFRSLAQSEGERAICVVLSGCGSDGTNGLMEIKEVGGLVFAQKPESAEYEGMPLSAIGTGMVDEVLESDEIFNQLMYYKKHQPQNRSQFMIPISTQVEIELKKVFALIKKETGHDFTLYKTNTIHRRIERRMLIHQIGRIEDYVKLLEKKSSEVGLLFKDLLIGVTHFFRDAEAFEALEEKVISVLEKKRGYGGEIRVWSLGCSTGEEAYSLAMLFYEIRKETLNGGTFKIFATDIDPRAIDTARAGLFPLSIENEISPQRLKSFFKLEADGKKYRIHKSIRDQIVFSVQDVIKDPPFSKLDLILCRNLLIYFNSDLQKKLIPLFHYSLNPGGFLFLGSSEGIGEYQELFTGIDRSSKIFQRKELSPTSILNRSKKFTFMELENDYSKLETKVTTRVPKELSLKEFTEQMLLQQLEVAAVMVNRQGDILFLHGRTGIYLELSPGEVGVQNIHNLAREGLRGSLSTALQQVIESGEIVRYPNLNVKTNGDFTLVHLTVCPAKTRGEKQREESFYLVILEKSRDSMEVPHQKERKKSGALGRKENVKTESRLISLEAELKVKNDYIQKNQLVLQSFNEDLRSSNEEMQSVNEELQSTNEELETSKEELQSVNEELNSVNGELLSKVSDLSRVNDDMNNLLAGTGIATLFVDCKLRILRFTPMASQIINVIATDVGRPVSDIVSKLVDYDHLLIDVQSVLDTLIPKELSVQTKSGRWYLMRINPYRTLENVIEGAVLSFIDISEQKKAEESLKEAGNMLRLAVVVRDSYDAITVQNLAGEIIAWNPAAVQLYGWSEPEVLGMRDQDRIPESLRAHCLNLNERLIKGAVLEPYQTKRINKEGGVIEIWMTKSALLNQSGKIYGIATTEKKQSTQQKPKKF